MTHYNRCEESRYPFIPERDDAAISRLEQIASPPDFIWRFHRDGLAYMADGVEIDIVSSSGEDGMRFQQVYRERGTAHAGSVTPQLKHYRVLRVRAGNGCPVFITLPRK